MWAVRVGLCFPQATPGVVNGEEAKMPDEYLMREQFCERFHISDRTAERWRATGEGPPFVRLGQRKIAYRASDCEHWAAARTFRHRAEELQSVARGGASAHDLDLKPSDDALPMPKQLPQSDAAA
jgi:predicted DNA-binding transcriptional regulator AlpA